jgi:hypothetical protein
MAIRILGMITFLDLESTIRIPYPIICSIHIEPKHVKIGQCIDNNSHAVSKCTNSRMIGNRPKHVAAIKSYMYLIQLYKIALLKELLLRLNQENIT